MAEEPVGNEVAWRELFRWLIGTVALLNLIAAIIIGLTAWWSVNASELDVRMRMAELDRAEAFDYGSLQAWDNRVSADPQNGLTEVRGWLPLWIAEAPLRGQRAYAQLSVAALAVNALGWGSVWIILRVGLRGHRPARAESENHGT